MAEDDLLSFCWSEIELLTKVVEVISFSAASDVGESIDSVDVITSTTVKSESLEPMDDELFGCSVEPADSSDVVVTIEPIDSNELPEDVVIDSIAAVF